MSATIGEILSQPTAWQATLATLPEQIAAFEARYRPVQQVICVGCGSAYYLSLSLAALYRTMTGQSALAVPASEFTLFPQMVAADQQATTLLVVISRSGETSETLAAVERFRQHYRGLVVALTTRPDNSLARLVDVVMLAPVTEQSVVQTRSITSLSLLGQALIAHLAGENVFSTLTALPEHGERLLHQYHALARQLGENADLERVTYLGMGELWGSAQEAMLKITEMALFPAAVFHTMEFRHGPNAMIDAHSLIGGLLTTEATPHEVAVLRDMHQLGGHVLVISENGSGFPAEERWHEIVLDSRLPAWGRLGLYQPVLQLMSFYRAQLKGINPDQPRHLHHFVAVNLRNNG